MVALESERVFYSAPPHSLIHQAEQQQAVAVFLSQVGIVGVLARELPLFVGQRFLLGQSAEVFVYEREHFALLLARCTPQGRLRSSEVKQIAPAKWPTRKLRKLKVE